MNRTVCMADLAAFTFGMLPSSRSRQISHTHSSIHGYICWKAFDTWDISYNKNRYKKVMGHLREFVFGDKYIVRCREMDVF